MKLRTKSAPYRRIYQKALVRRLNHAHALYLEEGRLTGVARLLGVTRERVRQLLVRGAELGLYVYPPPPPGAEEFREACRALGRKAAVGRRLGISTPS